MRLIEHIRQRWHRFMGDPCHEDVQRQIASANAEVAFRLALKHMQSSRGQFDIRTKSDPPSSLRPITLSGLEARLTLDDVLMKEAINGLDSPQADSEDQRVEGGSGGTQKPD